VKKIAKKIQGSLPIIGLVSRLTAPDGGFDDLAYPEYARGVFDRSPPGMGAAMQQLEAKHGKMGTSRYVLLMTWMVKTGLPLVAPRDIVLAARRLRITQDLEVEIDRFEGAKLVARKKYEMVAPPDAKPADMAAVAVDAVATVAMGLKDGAPVPAGEAEGLAAIVSGALPEVSLEVARAAVADREKRAAAYA